MAPGRCEGDKTAASRWAHLSLDVWVDVSLRKFSKRWFVTGSSNKAAKIYKLGLVSTYNTPEPHLAPF